MAGRQFRRSWFTLFLLVGSIAVITTVETDVNKMQTGSCSIGEGDSITCDSSVLTAHSPVSHVSEGTFCRHVFDDTCFMCLKGVLSESKCQGAPLLRKKRFLNKIFNDFFKKIISALMVCSAPSAPANGQVKCPAGTRVGKQCIYSCHDGYRLVGSKASTCRNNRVFTAPPRCEKIDCGTLALSANAHTVSCSDGSRHRSVCSVQCKQGFVHAAGLRAFCGDDAKWVKNAWECQDTINPVFTKCPSKKINTIDRMFRWSVRATDNTGKVTVKQIQGNPPGSLLEYGAQLIKYMATDEAGNKAYCSFVVEMKISDCPKPSSTDTDIEFMCNGLTAQSYCQLSCKSGSRVEGSKYIKCEEDKSQNNTSTWQPVEGVEATCHKRSCPALNTPKNGALACDKNMGGTLCQIQCNVDYDIPFSDQRFHTFMCGSNSDAWYPSNTAPDCLELSFPDEYYLPTDFYYFTGDCSDPQALNAIKQQFIDNLNSIGISPCMTDVCSVDDIQVDCGDMVEPSDFGFRRKRNINPKKRVLHVRVRFHVKNTNRTLSPAEADALLKSLVEKSKNVMSTNPAMRTMVSKALPPQISTFRSRSAGALAVAPAVVQEVRSKSVTGNMTVKCEAGKTHTKSGSCVPCSAGLYADVNTKKCKTCPVNTYQDQAAMSSCLACPAHHVTSSTGAVTRDQCKEQCGPETFSPTGLVPCFPCPDGRYQPQYGSTTCQVCPQSPAPGQGSQKCLSHTKLSSNDLQISNFLLTCGSEICLSF